MRQVAHVLLTRPPLASLPKEIHSLDLHVLGTPPAFILSQDQTLQLKVSIVTPKRNVHFKREFSLLELISFSVA